MSTIGNEAEPEVVALGAGRAPEGGAVPATVELAACGLAFAPDGPPRPEPLRRPFPPELWREEDYPDREEVKQPHRARNQHLRRAVGLEPPFVLVRG